MRSYNDSRSAPYEPLLHLINQMDIQALCMPVRMGGGERFDVTRSDGRRFTVHNFFHRPSRQAPTPGVLTLLVSVLQEARTLERHPTLSQWELTWDYNTDDPALYAACEQAYQESIQRNERLKAFLGDQYQACLSALP